MEIQQLKGFVAVAKHGSFSKAAGQTFRTQPAISLQVQSLENELGVKLFERLGHKKISLTPAGRALLELASPLLADMDALKTRFEETRGKEQKGPVRLATHASVMTCLLPQIIQAFKKKFPACELSIVNRSRQDILSLVNDGEVDIGITSLVSVPRNCEYRVFARFNRVLIAPKRHPLARKASILPKDIVVYPLIIPPQGTNTRRTIDRVFEGEGLAYNTAIELTGREAAKVYVDMGMGVSIINEYYLKAEDRKNFFVKNMSNYFGQAERGIITREGRYLSTPVKEFINLIFAKFPEI